MNLSAAGNSTVQFSAHGFHACRQAHREREAFGLVELSRLPNLPTCHMSWVLLFCRTVTSFVEMLVHFHQNCNHRVVSNLTITSSGDDGFDRVSRSKTNIFLF